MAVDGQVMPPLPLHQPARGRGTFGAAHANPSDAYAGVPILNAPLWHDEVAVYFYLGGISSGSFVLGALADLSGARWRSLAQTAYLVSFAAMLPCPALLIHDLGMPSRFHHMMRIFKPSSPMNLGVWALLAHSGFATLQVVRVLAEMGVLPAPLATAAARAPAGRAGPAGRPGAGWVHRGPAGHDQCPGLVAQPGARRVVHGQRRRFGHRGRFAGVAPERAGYPARARRPGHDQPRRWRV